jgi:hypothetical protein
MEESVSYGIGSCALRKFVASIARDQVQAV